MIAARPHALAPCLVALALTGCVAAPAAVAPASSGPLRVTNNGTPFANHEGAAARQMAEAECAARGTTLRTGIYDRFEAGVWVYPGGCA
ncbi:hypothetical protein [Paragemmobacter ruber]|uniref:Lipoprotein n=1 Tax=Paragemmobacter ruber TaxID=1985673 RepID=A0ABW9Y8R2_9RHOB|nr:hypothetical protein [Rhodobacter ruber]NBE08987.1 hypothetical protein [Rhodobacter ruber]